MTQNLHLQVAEDAKAVGASWIIGIDIDSNRFESVFEEFLAYHASSKADQTSMKSQELQFGKSYSIEDYQGGLELQPYNQNEA